MPPPAILGTVDEKPRIFTSDPTYPRWVAVWATVCVPGVFAVVAVAVLHGSAPPYFDVGGVAVALPVLGYLIRRAATISLVADESRVVIRNPYRTWTLNWDEIEGVELSSKAAPFGSQRPAILFRTTSRKESKVKALAVPRSQAAQEWVVEQLLSLAPGHLAVRSEAAR